MGASKSRPLKDKLLQVDNVMVLHSGDLLLQQTDDLEIAMNGEIWAHVAVVVVDGGATLAYSNGKYENASRFRNTGHCAVRHLNCVRPSGFDARVMRATRYASKQLHSVAQSCREGTSIATVLLELGLVTRISPGDVLPHHFSSDSPFQRFRFEGYSANQ